MNVTLGYIAHQLTMARAQNAAAPITCKINTFQGDIGYIMRTSVNVLDIQEQGRLF